MPEIRLQILQLQNLLSSGNLNPCPVSMDNKPTTKQILILLGIAGVITASIFVAGLPRALTPFLKKQHKKWGHFNKRILKAQLKRLQKTGVIEQNLENGEVLFKLTNKGRTKLFKYQLESFSLDKNNWDGKWRLVAYDIPIGKKNQAEAFRTLIKRMQFYQLQKSLWLTPYKCDSEIEFLKNLYSLENHVTILTVTGLESESAYKSYFGI